MLSILIPTFNYNCYELITELHQQALNLNIPFEILVADDASSLEETKLVNRKINHLSNCEYIELQKNIGRAKIRNLLGERAKFDYLIFMDCDAKVCDASFIARYLSERNEAVVVVGGILNPPQLPTPDVSLRYYYEQSTLQQRSIEKRNQSPYSQFTTFNFFIHREVFLSIKFDESFTQYGHEDTLFGAELKKRNIQIKHIHNPLYHLGLERNEVYLEKVHTSIKCLVFQKEKLQAHTHLFIFYKKIKKARLDLLIRWLFKTMRPILIKNLMSSHPNMKCFAFYKLGYICEISKKYNNN